MTTIDAAEQVLDPLVRCLSPEVAQRIAELELDPALDDHLQELGRKSNNGQLTEEERAEYAQYAEYLDMINLIRLKARRMLNESKP